MATTYQLIASTTVGSGGASYIEFTSIPNTYTDLKLSLMTRQTGTGDTQPALQFNGITSNQYSYKDIYQYASGGGNGIYAGSGVNVNSGAYGIFAGTTTNSNYTSNAFASYDIYIPNYLSNNYKIVSIDNCPETNSQDNFMNLIAGIWNNTNAITSIKILPYANYVQYSTAYLYGIKNS